MGSFDAFLGYDRPDEAKVSQQSIMGSKLAQIANELAMDIMEPEDIRKLYGYTPEAWDNLIKSPLFDQMLQDAIATWNGAKNVEMRIRLKAQASVEMSLLRFHEDMQDRDITLSARTEALKTVMKLAGMDKPEPAKSSTNGWSLQIVIGNQTVGVTPTTNMPPTIEGEVG